MNLNLTGVGDGVKDAEDEEGVAAAEDAAPHADGIHDESELNLVVVPCGVAGQDHHVVRRQRGSALRLLLLHLPPQRVSRSLLLPPLPLLLLPSPATRVRSPTPLLHPPHRADRSFLLHIRNRSALWLGTRDRSINKYSKDILRGYSEEDLVELEVSEDIITAPAGRVGRRRERRRG